MVIKYRVEFTDGSVVDLQSLSFRFNSYLTLSYEITCKASNFLEEFKYLYNSNN